MEEQLNNLYIKRSQTDYSMSFKLSIVREMETTGIGIYVVTRKYGIQSTKNPSNAKATWIK